MVKKINIVILGLLFTGMCFADSDLYVENGLAYASPDTAQCQSSFNKNLKKTVLFIGSGMLGMAPTGFSNFAVCKISNRVNKENKEVVLTGWSSGAFLYYLCGGFVTVPFILPPLYDYMTLCTLEDKAYSPPRLY